MFDMSVGSSQLAAVQLDHLADQPAIEDNLVWKYGPESAAAYVPTEANCIAALTITEDVYNANAGLLICVGEDHTAHEPLLPSDGSADEAAWIQSMMELHENKITHVRTRIQSIYTYIHLYIYTYIHIQTDVLRKRLFYGQKLTFSENVCFLGRN